ncbi:MAG: RNA polymerase sigma factor [Armatimonadota bacterium]|nr:RNA polymerase sigma factor [Armatimonadota bacterium]
MTQTSCASEVGPDAEVIARAQRGDLQAYDELVNRYRARALRVARSFLRDTDLSEDIAQEAFVRTFLSIRKLRDPAAFLVYLNRTIVRLSIDYRRKQSSREVSLDIDPHISTKTGRVDPRIYPMSTPVEESIFIHAILDKLSWKLRSVIVLRDVDGMEYSAIASVLRIPVGTVRSRLSAARAAFKALYLGGTAAEKEA